MLVSYRVLFKDFNTIKNMIEQGYIIFFNENKYSYTHDTRYHPHKNFADLHELCETFELLDGL
jgi:hypothetical protein